MLLRHAKSAWPQDTPDHDRPLAPRGYRDAPAVGRWLRRAGSTPDYILCSTARRARETWELVQQELHAWPAVVFVPEIYAASMPGLLDLVRRLEPATRAVVIVGHDPALPELALALAGQDRPDDRRTSVLASAMAIDRMREKFPTGAVAVLKVTGPWSELAPGRARLTSFVTPREMHDAGQGQEGGSAPGSPR